MYTRRMRQDGKATRKESARATVAATVFAAFSINEGLIMMASVPKKGTDAGIAPFMLDAVRNIQRRRLNQSTNDIIVVASHARVSELLKMHMFTSVIGLTESQSSLNIAAMLLHMCRPRILEERAKLQKEIDTPLSDWEAKVEHRQRLLRSIVFRAWSGLGVDQFRAALAASYPVPSSQ